MPVAQNYNSFLWLVAFWSVEFRERVAAVLLRRGREAALLVYICLYSTDSLIRLRLSFRFDESFFNELADNCVHGFGYARCRGVDSDFWVLGKLVGVVDSREALQLSGTSALVETFSVALLAFLEWGGEMCLEVSSGLGDAASDPVPGVFVGSNGGGNHDSARVDDQRANVADPFDVENTVISRESES